MNKITLKTPESESASFQVEGEPKSEADLLKYDQYTKFYYQVGLGAQVNAEVTVKKGLFSSKKYSFTYNIRGNAISMKAMQKIINKYCSVSKCEAMNCVLDQGKTIYIYSFKDYNDSYRMYQDLEGICNIGTLHGQDPSSGLYFLRIEYNEVN